jgi:hypothetical protein
MEAGPFQAAGGDFRLPILNEVLPAQKTNRTGKSFSKSKTEPLSSSDGEGLCKPQQLKEAGCRSGLVE